MVIEKSHRTKGKQGKLNSENFTLRPKNTHRLCCAQRRRVYILESTISTNYSRVFPKKASVSLIFGEGSRKISAVGALLVKTPE